MNTYSTYRIIADRILFFAIAWLLVTPASADFTKISNSGQDLPADATLGSGPADWACTRDDDTGLVWEIKTDDDGPRDKDNTYTNYDGNHGSSEQIAAATNSIGFANAVKAAGLCGYGDWRMPSREELESLHLNGSPEHFPNSPLWDWAVWSGTKHATDSSYATYLLFPDGGGAYPEFDSRGAFHSVRLVRDGQPPDSLDLSVLAFSSGSGNVTTGGMNCAHDGNPAGVYCTTARGAGSVAVLTATPLAGSTFGGWKGACSGSSPTCSLTMDAARTVVATFTRIPVATPPSTRSIVIDPNTPTTLYAGLDGGGGVYTKTASTDWTAINTGLTNLDVKALAIAASGKLFAGTDGGGVFYGTGSGSWTACGALPGGVVNIRSLALSGTTLYAGTTGGVFKSTTECTTWTAINSGLPN